MSQAALACVLVCSMILLQYCIAVGGHGTGGGADGAAAGGGAPAAAARPAGTGRRAAGVRSDARVSLSVHVVVLACAFI